ncbi:cupin domain-containing protein [Actinomadura madurae]|uniref:cupin domain-containing protein n=1 Tax=Actinomadura madurae TaxID=1993 RepID=UPI0027E2D90A|nr:cupin domain-containing protein [Actinomadura madurae]
MARRPVRRGVAVARRRPAGAAARRRGERPSGTPERITLGPDVAGGQVPQAVVPANAWQAARPAGDEEVLVSCVVSPGFDFADFRALP